MCVRRTPFETFESPDDRGNREEVQVAFVIVVLLWARIIWYVPLYHPHPSG